MKYEFIFMASCGCNSERIISKGVSESDIKPELKIKCPECEQYLVEISCEKRTIDNIDINVEKLSQLSTMKRKSENDKIMIQQLSEEEPKIRSRIISTENV